MTDREPITVSEDGVDVRLLDTLNTWGMVSYILHLVVAASAVFPGAQAGVVLLVVAVIIDLVKRDDAKGTWHASHFRWRLQTLLIVGGLYVVTSPLFLLLFVPGQIAWWLISVWFLYRIVKGMLALNAGREVA
ncbi:MAG TPA: hypothetical protein VFY35_15765 [Burkholderiaceae bacterium]|nr:hypothetical protein [Burkholderiaceae bacterium]